MNQWLSRCFRGIQLLLCALPIASAFGQHVHLAPLPANEKLIDAISLPDGRFAVLSDRTVFSVWGEDSAAIPQTKQTIVRILDADGATVAVREIGGSRDETATAIARQSDGRIVVLGSTNSTDFPVVNPLFPGASVSEDMWAQQRAIAYVIQLNADLSEVLRATMIGENVETSAGTIPSTLAIGPDNRIFIAGQTEDRNFPKAPNGKFLDPAPKGQGSLWREGFILGFDDDLETFLFSSTIGGVSPLCQGVSSCAGNPYDTNVPALHAGRDGILTAYLLNSSFTLGQGSLDLSNKYQPHGSNSREVQSQVVRVNTQQAEITWMVNLGYMNGTGAQPRLHVDSLGNAIAVVLADWRENDGIPHSSRPRSTDVLKISSDGSTLMQRKALAVNEEAFVSRSYLADDNTLWLTGNTDLPAWKPISPETQAGSAFVLHLNLIGQSINRYLLLPNGSADVRVFGKSGKVWMAGSPGTLQGFDAEGSLQSGILGIANSAGFVASPRLSPGELISFYGVGLGPSGPQGATFDNEGKLPTMMRGAEVRIGGVVSPLLYVSGTQINAIVPFGVADNELADGRVPVQILYHGQNRLRTSLPVAIAQPHAFSMAKTFTEYSTTRVLPSPIMQIYGRPANTTDEVLRAGDVITVWMNGGGAWQDAVVDGKQQGEPYNRPKLRLRAVVDGQMPTLPAAKQEATVEYFGAAPGFGAGLLQANIRIPEGFPTNWNAKPVLLQLSVGEDTAQGFQPASVAPETYIAISGQ